MPDRYRKPTESRGGARRSLRDIVADGGQRLRFCVLAAFYTPYVLFLAMSAGETSSVPYLFGLGMCWLAANILVGAAKRVASDPR